MRGGDFTIGEQLQTLNISPSATEVKSTPEIDRNSMRFATVSHPYSTGDTSDVTVGLSREGLLLVRVFPRLKAELDDRYIVLIGMAAAKTRLGVAMSEIKTVVIEIAPENR